MNKMNFQINDASDDDHNVRNIQVTASGTGLKEISKLPFTTWKIPNQKD